MHQNHHILKYKQSPKNTSNILLLLLLPPPSKYTEYYRYTSNFVSGFNQPSLTEIKLEGQCTCGLCRNPTSNAPEVLNTSTMIKRHKFFTSSSSSSSSYHYTT